MSARDIIAEWERRGRPLRVPEADTVIWREGDGEPIVCLHGVPASAFVYRKMLPELAAHGFEGVALDFPGLGLAERPRHFDYSWSGLSHWLLHALAAAGIDRFHLVVHDLGGPVGFDLVRRLRVAGPERIRSLTVMNSFVRVASFHRPWVMEPFAMPWLGWWWLQGMRTPVMLALMRRQGVHLGPTRDELRAYRLLLFRNDGGRAFLRIMRSFELTDEFEQGIVAALRERKFPAQIIWGGDDPALPVRKYVHELLEVLGLESWHTVHGKHFLQEDSPRDIAARIARLAASVPA